MHAGIYPEIMAGEILMVNQNHNHSLSLSLFLVLARFLSLSCVQRGKRRENFVEIMREKLVNCRTDRETIELDKEKKRKKFERERGREKDKDGTRTDSTEISTTAKQASSTRRPRSLFVSLSPTLSLSSLRLSRHARTDVPETDVFSTLSGIYVDRSWAERAVRVLTKNRESRGDENT